MPVRVLLSFGVVAILCLYTAAPAQDQYGNPSGVPLASAKVPAPEARVDINHASLDELMKTPGMTHTWAARIVRFRPYRTKQELLDRGVLPSAVYDRIKDFVIAHRDKQ